VPGRGWGIALLLAALLAGCGSGGSQGGLTTAQRQTLLAELAAARSAAAAHDLPAARTALAKFRASVTLLRRVGALSDSDARQLRIGAARVLARVQSDNPPPVQPVQTTPAPAPAPPPPGQAKKKEEKPPKHGKDHGHGHGGEGGD
jgi:hypothetical protein